jgi:dCTP deaminase
LRPGRFVLGATIEKVSIPDFMVGRVEGKSTRARQGIQIHAAGYLDPGFEGNVTLEIVNLGERIVVLWPGILIAQFSFEKLEFPCDVPYNSERNHYQGSEGVIGAGGLRKRPPHLVASEEGNLT